jgi:hypothetical protein
VAKYNLFWYSKNPGSAGNLHPAWIYKNYGRQHNYNVSEFVFPFFLEVEASFWG